MTDGSPDPGVTRISILGIGARGSHGVYEHERREGQQFRVDVVIDVVRGDRSDDLSTTVDYGGLAEGVVSLVEGEPVQLIETLAERIAALCCQPPSVTRAQITVHKPQAPLRVPFDDVTVQVVHQR
jgi:dihydroneopterin aldolase